MRFFTISFLLGSLLLISATGCQNSTIRCQRETALLRAEILDLEDKYYALKSQHQNMLSGGNGAVVTNNVIGSGVIMGTPVVDESWPVQSQYIQGGIVQGEIIQGDVIYDDQIVSGSPIMHSPVEGEVYYEGQAVPSAQNVPTPATDPGSFELDMENPPADPATATENDQTIALPDSDSLELEVGFEELELDLASDEEIDRIEIVTSATRGKDLDGIPGHDGLEVMIKAVNSDGEFVDKTGELTVTVRDNLAGEIGKWTFLPNELSLFLSRDELGNMGTLLHLPWSDKIPVSKQVEVRVSMLIGKIEYVATLPLEIQPPTGQPTDDAVVGWATSDDRWLSVSQSPIQSQPASSVNTWPAATSKSSSTAVKRPQWKPVR